MVAPPGPPHGPPVFSASRAGGGSSQKNTGGPWGPLGPNLHVFFFFKIKTPQNIQEKSLKQKNNRQIQIEIGVQGLVGILLVFCWYFVGVRQGGGLGWLGDG